ncbi:6-carboxytetrahydropterin synthase QueD [Dehalococcoidia bacterium]|nr:6-carboxytetrahydropterin synthase QueD [Dehalococcoidia bacterium]
MDVFKEFTVEAAHRLPNVPEDHKCSRLHGHSFHIEVWVRGDIDPNTGWVIDFSDISEAFAPLFEKLDHRYLNDVEGLSNPTSENLARWVWGNLTLLGLSKIVIHETCTAGCVYQRDSV